MAEGVWKLTSTPLDIEYYHKLSGRGNLPRIFAYLKLIVSMSVSEDIVNFLRLPPLLPFLLFLFLPVLFLSSVDQTMTPLSPSPVMRLGGAEDRRC